MGVLRIKKTPAPFSFADADELFNLAAVEQPLPRLRASGAFAVICGVALAGAIASGVFWQMHRESRRTGDMPFVYFEIKAVDEAGHAVAGATVKRGDETVGVTDSFGEWRRFLRVKLGTTVAIGLAKKASSGAISAVKNLAIPGTMPASGDLQINGSVLLLGSGSAEPVARSQPPHQAPPAASEVEQVRAAAVAPSSAFTSIAIATSGVMSAHLEGALAQAAAVAPSLGLQVDPASPWQVQLTELAVGGTTGRLVQVDGWHLQDGKLLPAFSYLRHYSATTTATATDLLATAQRLVALGDTAAPVPGWQRLKLRVLGPLAPDLRVYVGGYQAVPSGARLFEYWGAPLAAAMVTVVSAGRVLYRGRLLERGDQLPSVSLPSPALSRR